MSFKNITQETFGFVVLSPDHNVGRLRTTINSIKSRHIQRSVICITGSDATEEDIIEMNELCPTFKAGNTITSLINMGMKKGCAEWNVFITEGTYVPLMIEHKLFRYATSKKDILYPILANYDHSMRPVKIFSEFHECTLNGLTIHAEAFNEVGDFSNNPLDISKLFWAINAIEKGCRFKGVLGVKLC